MSGHAHPTVRDQFIASLRQPRAALAYGIDTRELRHNAFLHFLLGPLVPEAFRRDLLKRLAEIAAKGDKNATEWNNLASANIRTIEPKYNVNGRSGRPDEVITCITETGGMFIIVIEMKVKAEESDGQLSQYVDEQRSNHPGATVLGTLLRIPGRDVIEHAFFVTTGQHLRDAIDAAWKTTGVLANDSAGLSVRYLIADYLATLEFLDLMDKIVVEEAAWLKSFRDKNIDECNESDRMIKGWVDENWRWCGIRLMRDVVFRLNLARRGMGQFGAYGDKDSANMDGLFFTDDRAEIKEGNDGASIYAQWKLGDGFHVRAIIKEYGSKAPRSRELMKRLAEHCKQVVGSTFESAEFAKNLPSNKDSCMIARFKNGSYDAQTIVDVTCEHMTLLEPLIEKCVSSFSIRNSPMP